MKYDLVYDAATASFPWDTVFHVALMLAAGAGFFVVSVIRKRRGHIIFMIVWIAGVLLLGGLGSSNVIHQYVQCKRWSESRDYSLVEGTVTNFHPMPKSGHDTERFTVEGVKFEYSDFDLSKGGFNNTASHGGPIREGLPVRIAYRDGRILKLEIGKN
jgi:hypothetical protein